MLFVSMLLFLGLVSFYATREPFNNIESVSLDRETYFG